MPITHTIEPETGVIYRRYDGEITIDEVSANWRELLSAPDTDDGRPVAVISDVRGGKITYTGGQLEHFVRTVMAPGLRGRRLLSAVIVESQLQFGVMRQFSTFTDDLGEIGLFYDPETARAWLNESLRPQADAQR